MKELFFVEFVRSEDNTADIFTKSTSPQIFNKLSQKIVENVRQAQFADIETQNGGSVERQTTMDEEWTDILCEGQTEKSMTENMNESLNECMTKSQTEDGNKHD